MLLSPRKPFEQQELSKLRLEAILSALNHRINPQIDVAYAKSLNISESEINEAQTLAQNQYQAWLAQDEQLKLTLKGHQAELQSARSQEQKLVSVGAIEHQKTDDYRSLKAENFISEHAYLEQESKLLSNQNDLQSTRSQIQKYRSQSCKLNRTVCYILKI